MDQSRGDGDGGLGALTFQRSAPPPSSQSSPLTVSGFV